MTVLIRCHSRRPKHRRVRCGRLDPSLLGESWNQVPRTSSSPTAFRAHITLYSVHAMCQTVLTASPCSATTFAVFVLQASAQIEALPQAGQAGRRKGA
jgi:hypothetical protein